MDSPLGLVDQKLPLAFLQGCLYLVYQGILKQVTILSLDPNLSVFYQKSSKHILSFPMDGPHAGLSPGHCRPPNLSVLSAPPGISSQYRNFTI